MKKAKSDKDIAIQENEALAEELELTEKQKAFCREYIFEWNATKSYRAAYPDVKDDNVAAAASSRLLSNVKIQKYIEEIQANLEKLAGLSRFKVISEHMKLAFSSIAHLHNTWIERKDFEALTDEQKACIAEIDTKILKRFETEYSAEKGDFVRAPIEVEYIKVKLYDKQKALDSISKMLGYDAPSKVDLNVPQLMQLPDINIE
jgi:phage terminase small subunit